MIRDTVFSKMTDVNSSLTKAYIVETASPLFETRIILNKTNEKTTQSNSFNFNVKGKTTVNKLVICNPRGANANFPISYDDNTVVLESYSEIFSNTYLQSQESVILGKYLNGRVFDFLLYEMESPRNLEGVRNEIISYQDGFGGVSNELYLALRDNQSVNEGYNVMFTVDTGFGNEYYFAKQINRNVGFRIDNNVNKIDFNVENYSDNNYFSTHSILKVDKLTLTIKEE